MTQGAADLSKLPEGDAPAGEAADVTKLIAALKAALGDSVGDVRATDRLVASAVVLSAPSFGPDLQMQRILKRHGRQGFAMPATLELNARHALVRTLAGRADADEDLADAAHLLLDVARVQDGELPTDPAAFARRVTEALAKG